MGQSLVSMNQQQSKDELLYQLVNTGDVEAIKALCREGASLEWIDIKGKTPLIVACMNPALFNVAKTLIELGANVNAYRPGHHGGTPLHHAAKRGLGQMVTLLLSHGANALVRNDDCQTPLGVARIKGYTNVVRLIENHICNFAGWLREFYGLGFLEALAPQFLSRKIWAVVIPCGSKNPMKPLKLELAIYSTQQEPQPRTVISLWKANIEEPKFLQPDPLLTIFDHSTKTRYKLASANEGDKQQLQWLYSACKGLPQVMPSSVLHGTQTTIPSIEAQTAAEAVELAMEISASIQFSTNDRSQLLPNAHQRTESVNTNGWGDSPNNESHNGWGPSVGSPHSEETSSEWMNEPAEIDYNGWSLPDSGPIGRAAQRAQIHDTVPVVRTSSEYPASVSSAPSAPPISEEVLVEGAIHYPSIDFSPVDLCVPAIDHGLSSSDTKDGDDSTSCVICWEAPIEGACIPCGHMAGCMSCLSEIKSKKGVCPVCRAKINQVIRLYAV